MPSEKEIPLSLGHDGKNLRIPLISVGSLCNILPGSNAHRPVIDPELSSRTQVD
jgi:hypothetical protein